MAFSDWNGEQKDVSKFNPAALKMMRINDLSKILNESKLNPKAWNADWGDWNYIVSFKALRILYREVFIKFSEEEKKLCQTYLDLIEKQLKSYPIQERLKNGKWTSVDEERFAIFQKHIDKCEDIIKEFQDDHGLDTPSIEAYDEDEI